MFREQLSKLLSAPLKSLKAGPSGVEVEFDLALERAVTNVEATVEPTALPESPGQTTPLEDLKDVACKQPEAAVVAAAARLERELRDVLLMGGDQEGGDTKRGMIWLARRAADRKLVDPNLAPLIGDVAFLRNLAAHGHMTGTTNADDALRYLDMVEAAAEPVYDRGVVGVLGRGAAPVAYVRCATVLVGPGVEGVNDLPWMPWVLASVAVSGKLESCAPRVRFGVGGGRRGSRGHIGGTGDGAS